MSYLTHFTSAVVISRSRNLRRRPRASIITLQWLMHRSRLTSVPRGIPGEKLVSLQFHALCHIASMRTARSWMRDGDGDSASSTDTIRVQRLFHPNSSTSILRKQHCDLEMCWCSTTGLGHARLITILFSSHIFVCHSAPSRKETSPIFGTPQKGTKCFTNHFSFPEQKRTLLNRITRSNIHQVKLASCLSAPVCATDIQFANQTDSLRKA